MSDLMYLLMLLIPGICQFYVMHNYKKFSAVYNDADLTGFDVARKILDDNGLNSVYIVETKGNLSDHYDSNRKTVRLSSDVYRGKSVAAMAVAAHECGHALQDKEGYMFLKIRSMIFPFVNICTKAAYVVLLVGLLFEFLDLVGIGILLVGTGLLFQLVTLPVEFNASKSALNILTEYGYDSDIGGAKKMLVSAALTYVAGVLSSLLEVLRLIFIFSNERD